MIVVTLVGGIGNQMFEYAAAKTISELTNSEIVLNTKLGFKRDVCYRRVFCLDTLNVKYKNNRFLTFDFWGGRILEKVSKILGIHLLAPQYRYIYDSVTIEEIKNHPFKYRNVILQGSWMDLGWVQFIKETLSADFSPSVLMPSVVQKYYGFISESKIPVVALCVRIYQDVKDETLRQTVFFSTREIYYNTAIEYILNRCGKVHFLVFTQVKEWVEKNIDFHGMGHHYVQASTCDKDAIYDMSIISKCHHAIISNSSFYFWGAWMMKNDQSIVIIPKNWGKNLKCDNWVAI